MLRFLFPRLTSDRTRGAPLFDRLVREARQSHWYREGELADTIDGRFAILATVSALAMVALEDGDGSGQVASAALTERFIEAMDAEHRQLGLNDPGLGRRVRKLVRSLERRVDEWRAATRGELDWAETAVSSVYRDDAPKDAALDHSAARLRELWSRLSSSSTQGLLEGRF